MGAEAVAKLYSALQQVTEAKGLLEEAVTYGKFSADPSQVLFAISTDLAKLGELGQARQVAMTIENDARRADALSFLRSCERGQSDVHAEE